MVATIIQSFFQVVTLIIFVDVIISYFLSPYHPFRRTLDNIVNPLLNPIRKVVPTIQNIDFSPIVLLILLQIIEYIVLKLV